MEMCVKLPLIQFHVLLATVGPSFGLSPWTDRSSGDARAKVIELTSLILVLMKHNEGSVRDIATKILPTLVDPCMNHVSLPASVLC